MGTTIAHRNSALDPRVWADERRGLGLLSGERPIFALALGWQVVLTMRGYRVHNVDGANRCNVFHLAGECMERGVPVEGVLQSITVQRVFTPYQALDVAGQIAEQASRDARAKNDESCVYFFLSPCKQFFDGDVGPEEGEFLLRRLLGIFAYMARRSLPVLIVEREYEHPTFHKLFPELETLANTRWTLNEDGNAQLSGELSYGTYAGSLFHAD